MSDREPACNRIPGLTRGFGSSGALPRTEPRFLNRNPFGRPCLVERDCQGAAGFRVVWVVTENVAQFFDALIPAVQSAEDKSHFAPDDSIQRFQSVTTFVCNFFLSGNQIR